MDHIQAAHIECETCDCKRMYSGSGDVGDEKCESCGHPLRGGHKFVAAGGASADPETGELPAEFHIVPTFY
jgi:hypothetical protein